MKKLLKVGIAGMLSLGLSQVANAGGDMTEDAIEYRQAVMEIIVWNFRPMGKMVKGKIPYDAQAFAKKAENLAFLSHLPLEGFIPGSDKGETDAKSAIWNNWEDFKAKLEAFQQESAKLAEVAKTATTAKGVKSQFIETAKTCKGCHKPYKRN